MQRSTPNTGAPTSRLPAPTPSLRCSCTRRNLHVAASSVFWAGDSSAFDRQDELSPLSWELSRRFPSPRVNCSSEGLQDWRTYRAQLVEWERTGSFTPERPVLQRPVCSQLAAAGSWAHLLPTPEPGCLLLAKQDNMHFFTQTVVLITSHDDLKGSCGYVLNKPSPLHVGELQVGDAASAFKSTFGPQRLHLGGPVHLDHVTLLHRFIGIARAHRIAEGVYMGGLPEAVRMVNAGIARPSDFHLVLGMAGWGPQQLSEEVAKGYWHVVAASHDLMLPLSPTTSSSASATSTFVPIMSSAASSSSTVVPGLMTSPPTVGSGNVTSKYSSTAATAAATAAVAAADGVTDSDGCYSSPANGQQPLQQQRQGQQLQSQPPRPPPQQQESSLYRKISRLALRRPL